MKTIELKITTAVSAALALAGCQRQFNPNDGWTSAENTALCTDAQGHRVPDAQCDTGYHGGGAHWYYVPRGVFVPPYGEPVRGGSYEAPHGISYTRSSASVETIARGGFGSSAHFAAGE